MGKSAQTMVVILEGFLTLLYGACQLLVFWILKRRKPERKKTIPAVNNPLLLLSSGILADKIRKREVKSCDVVKAYISRIKEVNPLLNFVVDERYEAAMNEAEEVDNFLSTTSKTEAELMESLPFFGVPFSVKESLAVKGLHNTAGVHSRQDIIAAEDAPVVAAMRAAGAIPLIVTNTPEVCCWWETYNPLHGRTDNPYNTNHTPGGSSGGEGACIAAAGSLFGLGSDFGGSIRIPAGFTGIFGHRPTSLTTPIKGHYPVPANDDLKTLLVTGPLARYAQDLRLILRVISRDMAPDLNLDKPVDLKNIKVYYLEEGHMFLSSRVQKPIRAAVRSTAQHFLSHGVKVERFQTDRMKYAMFYWYAKIKTNDGPQLGRELANHNGTVSVTKEFLKSMVGASKHTFPVVTFGVLEAGNGIPYKGMLHGAVLDEYEYFQMELKSLLGDNAVLILPTHPTTAPRHNEPMARAFDIGYSSVFNVLGFPATTCPVGRDEHGLPIAVQVVANNRQDRLTLAVAEEIERAFGGWIPPYQH